MSEKPANLGVSLLRPNKRQVVLGTITRGLWGSEQLIDDIHAAKTPHEKIQKIRQLPLAVQQANIHRIRKDLKDKHYHTIVTEGTHYKTHIRWIGEDNWQTTQIRRIANEGGPVMRMNYATKF
jgi:hypothetical protein